MQLIFIFVFHSSLLAIIKTRVEINKTKKRKTIKSMKPKLVL